MILYLMRQPGAVGRNAFSKCSAVGNGMNSCNKVVEEINKLTVFQKSGKWKYIY